MATVTPLRVLVVDDSAYNRKNIAEILTTGSEGVEIVGKATDGEEALRLVALLRPDVITLDLEMPRMDGFTFLRILMARQPTPVIVISSYSNKENVFKALELEAIDFVAKPDRQFAPDGPIRREILSKVLLVRHLRPLASIASGPSRNSSPMPFRSIEAQQQSPLSTRTGGGVPRYVVGIGSRRAGPPPSSSSSRASPSASRARSSSPSTCPTSSPRPSPSASTRRARSAPWRPRTATSSRPAAPKICPGKMCMEITGGFGVGGGYSEMRLRIAGPNANDRYVPSADRLLRSVAQVAGSALPRRDPHRHGDDGVVGARAIRAAGGNVVAESEETAVVFGMPGAAVRAGVVTDCLPVGHR